MDQEPHFRLETRVRISWFEVDRNLSNDVVEVPWKWELDPVAAHRRYVGPLPTNRSAACFRCLGLGLSTRLGFGYACFRYRCRFRNRWRSPRGSFLRGLRPW